MTEAEFAELAAGHALNALSSEDERAFADALAAHPEWQHHVAEARDVAAELSETVAPVAPPASARADLLAMIAATPQEAAPPAEASAPAAAPAPRRRSRLWFALAAVVTLVLVVGAGTVVAVQQLARPASVVALERIEQAPDAQTASVPMGDGGEATAHWSESLGEAVLVTDGMPQLTADETFELWFVRDGTPVSAGTFAASDDGTATAALDGQFHSGDVIAVTVEQAGGSPTGQPTSDPIVAIET